MPFYTHVFEDNVHQIILLGGDEGLQKKIRNRTSPGEQSSETITVPIPHKKLIELIQTRRDIWFIADDKWEASVKAHDKENTSRAPGTLAYYSVPELNSTCKDIIARFAEKVAAVSSQDYLHLEIASFGESETEGSSDITLKITYWP
eukprot:NODE_7773_length_577_cov_56.115556_g7750_i0.p1 GENE.NODE_7773_length_577_cov_56.115556_g7750_i0~~NODE_7773_length_577_cov_56.115556_g7750_i0.p1  ORF type:complete len:147 (-),score=25.10 NODE_7773_length_577_cov_56.115556_g7750_i0:73-513(-)